MKHHDIVVLGSGIAGLVAAWELAQNGLKPLVIEAAGIPGGRTSTWTDADGRTVDTGLHVVADHYVNLQHVLARLGVANRLHWVGKHTYLRHGREPMSWYFSPYRPPFHLIRPAREMPLSLKTRLRLGRASFAMASLDQPGLAALDHETYLQWHRRMGLGDDFILELAEAASDAATFLPVDRASARAVTSWLKYLMRHQHAGDVGLFLGTLAESMIDPLVAAITALGGEVRTNTAVTRVILDGTRVSALELAPTEVTGPVHSADGSIALGPTRETITVGDVVSALSVQGLQAVLRASGPDVAERLGLGPMMGLATTPAVSLIATFDRIITPVPEGAPLCTGVAMRDFIDFRILERPGLVPNAGSTYQFVITRSDERIFHDDQRIVDDIVRDLVSVWPGAAGARVVAYAIERVGAAMFAATPGAHAKRPQAETRAPNLFVAGDFTHHELNASMEGAAFSGRRAADRVLKKRGRSGLAFEDLRDTTSHPWLRRMRRFVAA